MESKLSKNNLIYYLLPNQSIKLANINSKKVQANKIISDLSTEATISALKYRYTLKYLGKQYSQINVVCIPAKEPKIIETIQQNHQNTQNTPQQMPYLIKIPNNNENSHGISGYASGKRSAIVPFQGKFLRYKGCGNLFEGFPVQNNELRGCHFFHTAKRQLYMTRIINQILLKQIGLPSANIPLFMYEYDNKQVKQLNLKSDLQLLGKYCCVFQTLGDRRVGTHIISPLQILFLNLCNIQDINWLQIFQQKNRIEDKQPVQFLAYWLFLQPGEEFLQKILQTESPNNYIVLNQINLQNASQQRQNQFLEKILNKLIKNEEQRKFVKQFLESFKGNVKQLTSIIVEKIGFQMGQVKRIFCDYGINWGYFNDHGHVWHCNAHLNNFIVTDPKINSQFLLPLDYDLAFTREQFIRIDLDQQGEKKYGFYDKDQFQNFLCSQYQAMEMSVSGVQVMNFKYSIEYENENELIPTSPLRMARIVFRDTLLKAFRAGMRKQQSVKKQINLKWNQNVQMIKDLIKVCLIISQDFQT